MSVFGNDHKMIQLNEDVKLIIRPAIEPSKVEYVIYDNETGYSLAIIDKELSQKCDVIFNSSYVILFYTDVDCKHNIVAMYCVEKNNIYKIYPSPQFNEKISMDILNIFNQVLVDYNNQQQIRRVTYDRYVKQLNNKYLSLK